MHRLHARHRIILVLTFAIGHALPGPVAASVAQLARELPEADRYLDSGPSTLFEIGALEGRDWEIFESIRAAAFDGRGNLYVLDTGNPRILKFSPTGEFIAQIGRKGQGPGELTRPIGLLVVDDDIVVPDAAAGYVRYTQGGEYVATLHPAVPAYSRDMALSGGAVILPGGLGRATGAGGGVPILRLPLRGGAPAEEIFEASVPTIETTTSGSGESRTFTMRRPPVFSPKIHLTGGGPGQVAMVFGLDWSVRLIDDSGRLLAELTRPIHGRATTEADRQAVIDRRARASSGNVNFGGASRSSDAAMERPEFAPVVPAIRDLLGDGRGVLWVARETTPAGEGHPLIDVVTTEGRYIGTLRDQSLPIAFGADGRAAYVEHDDLGVARVVVRQLPPAWLDQ